MWPELLAKEHFTTPLKKSRAGRKGQACNPSNFWEAEEGGIKVRVSKTTWLTRNPSLTKNTKTSWAKVDRAPVVPATGMGWWQENGVNLGGGRSLQSRNTPHCTPAWATEQCLTKNH